MVEYNNLLHLQLMLFLLIGTGYALRKWKLITDEGQKTLTNLLIHLILPCNIIYSFLSNADGSLLKAGAAVFLLSLANQAAMYFLGDICYPRASKEEKAVLRYGTICSNAGFMGNPLMEGLYGSQGLLYASIYLIPQRIAMFSVGLACFTVEKGKNMVRKILLHPCIVAVMVGIAGMFLPFTLPKFLTETIHSIGSCNTAISMIVIGSILAEVEIRSVFSGLNFYYCLQRLLLIPGLMLLVCYLLHTEPMVAAACVILSGMPAGSTTAILAAQYGADERLAVRMVFLSTLLSMLTIPVWCLAVEFLFV